MKISFISNRTISFKGTTTLKTFPEVPSRPDFVKNIALNSAIETMHSNKRVSFLPAGSWITCLNYDPLLSDHDFTMLLPDDSTYNKQEAEIYDTKECLKNSAIKRFKAHGIKESVIEEKLLPSINIFPTPKVQECFNSYNQYINCTNLKISLHDKIDNDTGLWRMKGVVANHLQNEGNLLYLKKDGSVGFFEIKNNIPEFKKYLNKNGIYMQKESKLYSSDKLNIINEFISKMQQNTPMDKRGFYKYLNRVKKFFFVESENDLFLVSQDPRKSSNEKFAQRIKIEKEYKDQFEQIVQNFKILKEGSQNELPEEFTKETLKKLRKFKTLAEEILSWPTLRGFKIH